MNEFFSARLAALRKERGITQKEAAEALGVSGALLSHYEKGIRECGLQFICAAAAYYDVSCDYLLGVSNTKRVFHEQFDDKDTPQDKEFRTGTLFRAATMLSDSLSETDPAAMEKLRNFFALAVYRAALRAHTAGCIPAGWITLPAAPADSLSAALMNDIMQNAIAPSESRRAKPAEPVCVKTIIKNSERILKKEMQTVLNSSAP